MDASVTRSAIHDAMPLTDCMPENMQRILLQNAVLGLDPLRNVQITLELQSTTSGITFSRVRYNQNAKNLATYKPTNSHVEIANNRRP